MGEALLSRAYWPVTHRNELWRNWLLYTELFAWPLIAGKVRNTQAFIDTLSDQGYKAVLAVGQEDDIKALSTPTTGEFATQDTALIRRIQRLILGQTGTSGLQGGGSYAAVEILSRDVLGALTTADRKLTTSAAQQVLTFAEAAGLIQPGFAFVWRDVKSLAKDRAERDEILTRVGVKFTTQYYLDHYDLGTGDFTLAPAQQPAKLSALSAATPIEQMERAIARRGDKQPLDMDAIMESIQLASNPADLRDRLAAIIPDPEFAETLARMSFNAQVLGWESAEGEA